MHMDRRKYDGLTPESKFDMILDKLDKIEESFPFGLENHKTIHEQLEQQQKAEKDFIRDLKLTLMKNSIMGVILFVLSAAVLGLASKWASFIRGL